MWKRKGISERSGRQEPDLSADWLSADNAAPHENVEDESRKAVKKAMQLLLYRQRTEKELREKLLENAFSEKALEEAVAYVRSFGYLDDGRYAEVYLHSNQGKKSRAVIKRELLAKGVSDEQISQAFEEEPADEGEIIYGLLRRKAGIPHRLDERELRRLTGYLARKGFSGSDIWKQIRRYQDEEAQAEEDFQ